MSVTPSPYQTAIYDYLSQPTDGENRSLVVEAVAGSGKTTTILESLQYLPPRDRAKLLAFNKSIAIVLQAKIAEITQQAAHEGRYLASLSAQTFHSCGFGAVREHLGMERIPPIDARKLQKICRGWLNPVEGKRYTEFLCRLVGFGKGLGVGTALLDDTPATWLQIMGHHDLLLDEGMTEERACVLAHDLLKRSTRQAEEEGQLDYDDQIYLVSRWDLALPPQDWIFVDEAQDTNPVRRDLVRRLAHLGGQVVAVGDRHQAIYGFTGASHDAMDQIRAAFGATELPLSICYRCGKAIVQRAQTIVPQIEWWDEAPEGEIREGRLRTVLPTLGPADAVLCRTNAPLVELAYTLLARHIPCTILGRDFARNLIGLVERSKQLTLQGLLSWLQQYERQEVGKLVAKGEHAKAASVRDRVYCLEIMIDRLVPGERTIDALTTSIDELFSDGKPMLTLSTIHKAKGREWPHVAILRPDLIPGPWARGGWQLEQERNLLYVAWTRAQAVLTLIEPEQT
jgi:superfamily I DNA/RNA helicase